MRIFVAGASGQVASSLCERAAARGLTLMAIGRPQLDVTLAASFREIEAFQPDLIINAVGYTAVDKAESEPERAFAVNRDGAARITSMATRLDVPLFHISTDYVFDGTKADAYIETDTPCPTSVYGQSKLLGEQAVLAACQKAYVFRTAWVYSPFGQNFVKTMLGLAETKERLRVVDDQIGNPTSALDIADTLLTIAPIVTNEPRSAPGLYHLVGSGDTNWCDFAREIMRISARYGHRTVPVDAITTAEYPTLARRPPNSRLDASKLSKTFGIRLPNWQTSLEVAIARILQSAKASS
jgi:dTDP-4-dehydrorhamnose reductase